MSKIVLLTRPLEDSAELAKEIEPKGYQVLCEPFISVHLHDVALPDLEKYAALIATSANALKVLQRAYDIPIYCVGPQTSTAAHKLGFQNVINAKGGVKELAEILKAQSADKPYLYIRAQEVSRDLKALLSGLNIEEIIAYHTDNIEEISKVGAECIIKGKVDKVLFFSTKTAKSFVQWVEKAEKNAGVENVLKGTQALCLGDSMVESLTHLEWKNIIVAEQPSRESILELL